MSRTKSVILSAVTAFMAGSILAVAAQAQNLANGSHGGFKRLPAATITHTEGHGTATKLNRHYGIVTKSKPYQNLEPKPVITQANGRRHSIHHGYYYKSKKYKKPKAKLKYGHHRKYVPIYKSHKPKRSFKRHQKYHLKLRKKIGRLY